MKLFFLLVLHVLLVVESVGKEQTEDRRRFQEGCLHTKNSTKYEKKRVCNSDDKKNNVSGSLICEEPEFGYPEIRIHNGNWDSSFLLAWIYQIVLMELARVPVTVGYRTNVTPITSFYSPENKFEYSDVMYDWNATEKANSGKDGNIVDCSSTDEPCYHFVPEVWEGQAERYDKLLSDEVIGLPVSNGLFGKMNLFIPSMTAEMYPGLSIWYGLKGETNRKRLAEIFRRPTSWKDYCDNISITNCTNDIIASRYPFDEEEEKSYFVGDLFMGHFEYTKQNNCTENPTTCTGALISCSCSWSISIESQIYWNDVKGLSSKVYKFAHLQQIWHAANATNSHVIMCWFIPDSLPNMYSGGNFSFVEVVFPPPTDECLENKPSEADKCSDNFTDKIGDRRGSCQSKLQALKHISVKSLEDNNQKLDLVDQSPAPHLLRYLEVSNLQLDSILKMKQQGKDPREAVCDWIAENSDYLIDRFFPKDYPREAGNFSQDNEKWYLLLAQSIAIGVGIVTILAFLHVWKYRKTRSIVFAQPVFLYLLLSAFCMLVTGGFLFALKPTHATCAVSTILLILGETIELVPILIKTYAINHIMKTATEKRKRVNISLKTMLFRVSLVSSFVIYFLIAWFQSQPPTVITTRYLMPNDNNERKVVVSEERCGNKKLINGWTLTWHSWDGILLFAAFLSALQSQNVIKELNESRSLALMIYSRAVFQFLQVFVYVSYSYRSLDANQYQALVSLIVSINVLVAMGVYVFPKIFNAMKNPDGYRESKRQTLLTSVNRTHYDESNRDLNILVCTANLGNARPTRESMESWIPTNGLCSEVTSLDETVAMTSEAKFEMIAIGMQEATWKGIIDSNMNYDSDMDVEDVLECMGDNCTVKLRSMIQSILGEDEYYELVAETRGQMRFSIWVRHCVLKTISDIRVSGSNTGVGNVLANKGGIIASFNCMDTRFSFLSAHLAAHHGDSYYKTRCENLSTILKENANMFDIKGAETNNFDIDITVSSHHMFVLGDLNFRINLEEETHEKRVERALTFLRRKDYLGLYEFDELEKGLSDGDLLTGFKTLPCNFSPTFKVLRNSGFEYKEKRVPSYTDRILFKSLAHRCGSRDENVLHERSRPLAYEPCVDFVTSDHKPVRGAFRVALNNGPGVRLDGTYRVTLSRMSCRNLRPTEAVRGGLSNPYLTFLFDFLRGGLSNPYLTFLFEAVDIHVVEEHLMKKWLLQWKAGNSWIRTDHVRNTLNPTWEKKTKLSFLTGNCDVRPGQTLFVAAMNHEFWPCRSDRLVGVAALDMLEMFTFNNRHNRKKSTKCQGSLIWEGKETGTVEFKVKVEKLAEDRDPSFATQSMTSNYFVGQSSSSEVVEQVSSGELF